MTRVLVVDNYDSFVYTIVDYLRQLGAQAEVYRNDQLPAEPAGYDAVLVSPGPGTPADAGSSIETIEWCAETQTPMLGVCLGHQALGEYYGATVEHAPELRHGKTSRIEHEGSDIFAGIPSPFTGTRYHSLAVARDTVPDVLRVTAWTDGVVMGLQHRELPLYGVQFHPESVMSEYGHRLLANWLEICGQKDAVARSESLAPLI